MSDVTGSSSGVIRRSVGVSDQARFAELSGDFNPMHLDPLAARRTQAGKPVVHGMHMVLMALDAIAERGGEGIRSINGRFIKFWHVGETAELEIEEREDGALAVSVSVERAAVAVLLFGRGGGAAAPVKRGSAASTVFSPLTPIDNTFEKAANLAGRVPFATKEEAFEVAFPAACKEYGRARVAGIACLSRIVGMVCPGLHSIYGSLNIEFCEVEDPGGIDFQVATSSAKHNMLNLAVEGSGLRGRIGTFLRSAPTSQASIKELSALIPPNEFSGKVALVVGASRGLGELTSKVIAAGGGSVIATYAVGKEEAERVASEIREIGGKCEVMRFDVLEEIEPQMKALAGAPGSLYYFATTRIFRRKSKDFEPKLFEEFTEVYVRKFHQLCRALYARAEGRALSVFYPSSVAIDERPADTTEYAMAKAAGEILCDDLKLFFPEITVTRSRLPRLATDQTNSVGQSTVATESPIEVMLPLIREVESKAVRN